ncbi:hypothetical protein BH24CHL4_BH24CHL4_04090 [soil metagenome]
MIQDVTIRSKFLEPVYINEKMILNCAAYLFSGIPTESETSTSSEKARGFAGRWRIPFLSEYFGLPELEATSNRHAAEQSRIARQFTVGGLHMSVLDELARRNMISTLDTTTLSDPVGTEAAYVDVDCVLEPSDYYSLIGTIKILGPLVAQISRDFGEKFLPQIRPEFKDKKRMLTSIDAFEKSVGSLIQQLESDYLTSGQLEMVMWSSTKRRPIGVVDLDLGSSDAAETRTRLSGGEYHVVGKVSRFVERDEKIDLLQKTVMANTINLLLTAMDLIGDETKISKFRDDVRPAVDAVKKFVRLDIPGPAIRINAMSVCI